MDSSAWSSSKAAHLCTLHAMSDRSFFAWAMIEEDRGCKSRGSTFLLFHDVNRFMRKPSKWNRASYSCVGINLSSTGSHIIDLL